MSRPNFSITDKLLTNLWIKICVQGYLSKVSPQGLTMCLATRCNANSCVIFIITTHVMSYSNLSITDKLLTNLWLKICVEGYLSKGSPQCITCF